MAKKRRVPAEFRGIERMAARREAIERIAAQRVAERKRKKKRCTAREPKPEVAVVVRDPATPPWAPAGFELNRVPGEVQQAAREIVQPVYEQFVLHAADGLEKSVGVTIAHLLWLEILEQFDVKREYVQFEAGLNLPGDRQETIAQHLRLLDSKVRVGYFLVRIRELRTRAAAVHEPELLRGSELDSPVRRLDVAPTEMDAVKLRPTDIFMDAHRAADAGTVPANAQVLNPEPGTLADSDCAKSTIC